MSNTSSERGARANMLAAGLVLLLGLAGAVWKRQVILGFYNENPFLNTLISSVFAIGVGYAGYWLLRLQREFGVLEAARAKFASPGGARAPNAAGIGPMAPSLIHERLSLYLEQIGRSQAPDGGSHADKISMTLSLHTGVTRYIAGLLVFLGLLGTFIGLLMSIGSIGSIIESMPTDPTDDAVTFLSNLQTQIGGPLEGMGTAFSTSVFGLVGSLFMGFLHLQLASAQTRFIARFEALDTSLFLPVFNAQAGVALPVRSQGGGGAGIDETIARYIEASQRQLKENLDRLGTIVERTEGMQANFRDVLTAIGGQIETTNNAIGRLSTNQDLIREAMGKMVDLARAGDENQRLMLAELTGAGETLARLSAVEHAVQIDNREFHDEMLRALRQESGAWQKAAASNVDILPPPLT
jgi:hypothetical protein